MFKIKGLVFAYPCNSLFRPISISFTRYGSFKRINILKEMAESLVNHMWYHTKKGSFRDIKDLEYIKERGEEVSLLTGLDNTFIGMGSILADGALYYIT